MKTKTTKENRKRLHSLILLTAFTAILLIVSTYAWFTTQKEVSISNLRGKVEVAEGLQISLDAKKWVQHLDLNDADTDLITVSKENDATNGDASIKFGPYKDHKNIVPTEFLPVSTSAEKKSEKNLVDPTADDFTKMDGLVMMRGNFDGTDLGDIAVVNETTEGTASGYYAFDIFLKNSTKNAAYNILQLDSTSFAWTLPENEPLLIKNEAGNLTWRQGKEEYGVQNTIRVAFAKYDDSEILEPSTGQEVVLNKTAGKDITKVSIWEPNADTHKQWIIDNVKPLLDATTTTPAHGMTTATSGNVFTTAALNYTAVGGKFSPFDWNETNTKVTKVKTLQTNALGDGYMSSGLQNLKTTDYTDAANTTAEHDKNDYITLEANSITKLRVYIYLEGQDPDCENYASYGGGIEVNIALTKDKTESDTGLIRNMTNIDANLITNLPAMPSTPSES